MTEDAARREADKEAAYDDRMAHIRGAIERAAVSTEPPPDVERIAARHREPHKCPREDRSSACDFNRYGAPAMRALSKRVE